MADFTRIAILDPDELEQGRRIAIMSQFGVNLLLQRWVHHNSRAIVRTSTIDEVTVGPYEEADLTAEWLADSVGAGMNRAESLTELDDWLGGSDVEKALSRRDLLTVSQARSSVRAALRRELRDRVALHRSQE